VREPSPLLFFSLQKAWGSNYRTAIKMSRIWDKLESMRRPLFTLLGPGDFKISFSFLKGRSLLKKNFSDTNGKEIPQIHN
jgi:hypothetical protein